MQRLHVCIITLLLTAICLTAQPTSPLKDSTVGLFSSDLDNVVSVTGWQGISFEKFLAGASYGYVGESMTNGLTNKTFYSNVLNGSVLFNINDIKVGISYTGELGNETKLEENWDEKENTTTQKKTIDSDHTLFTLVGIPINDLNLGIRLGVNMIGRNLSEEKESVTIQDQNDFSIRPQIMLGTSLALGNGWGITPTLNFGFTIDEAWRTDTYQSDPLFSTNLPEEIRSYKAYIPSGELEVGVTFPTENFALSAQLIYGLEYGFMPEKMYQKVNQDKTVDEHIYRTDERIKNTITLHTTGRKVFMDKFTLAARAYVQTSIDKWISGGTQRVAGNQAPVQTMEQTDITVLPRLYLAGTYQLNEKVSISAGLSFDPVTYIHSQTSSYDEDVETGEPKTTKSSHTFNAPLLSNLGFAMAFTPVQEFSVQLGVTLQGPQSWTSVLDGNIRLSATWKK